MKFNTSARSKISRGLLSMINEDRLVDEEFPKFRIMLAWVNGELIFNNKPNDNRDHQHWLLEDFGISAVEFEKLNCGYMIKNRIQLFKGSDFSLLNLEEVNLDDLSKIVFYYVSNFDHGVATIFNGAKIRGTCEPLYEVVTLRI